MYNYEVVNIMQLNLTCVFHHRQSELYSFRSPPCQFDNTLVPFPSLLCTSILPPWDSTISFVIAKPSPAPPLCLERDFSTRYNRSNIYGKSCVGIPSPSSIIVIIIC